MTTPLSGPPGVIVAAPASGHGKTTVTLGLLAALKATGRHVAALKVGPDYIDPAFHRRAGSGGSENIDLWAMRPETVDRAVERTRHADCVLVEGVMGLHDGAADGSASTAAVAKRLGLPVILVLDVRGQGASAAAVAKGLAEFAPGLRVSGVIANRVGGEKHRELLRQAFAEIGYPLLGCLGRDAVPALPSRHLGLVQAEEHPELESWLGGLADQITHAIDLDRVLATMRPVRYGKTGVDHGLPPLGQRIAVARDKAFAFSYPLLLDGWRDAGAEIIPFSPLADELPDPVADAVYLPGGYPELHAGKLAANASFLEGVRLAAARGARVFGECGGYMVLGRGLEDETGKRHAMAGLLDLETSFIDAKLTLGYRSADIEAAGQVLPEGWARLKGHCFHYARVRREEGVPLMQLTDALGEALGPAGLMSGTVSGSFLHVIDGSNAATR